MRKKRKELRKHAKKRKLQCIILFNLGMDPDPNFLYLTGYDGYGCLIMLKDREILLVPPMEYERARKTVKGASVKVYRKDFWTNLRRHCRSRTVGLDYTSVTMSFIKVLRKELKKRKFVDASSVLLELRAVKTEKEIRLLKKACSISDSILEGCFRKFGSFRTERDVARYLEVETAKRDCQLAFPPIVASGSGAAEPHHSPQNVGLKKGFCIIDFGVKHKGYHSDTTRTIYLGTPSQKDKELYNFMRTAQEEVVKSVKPGQKCRDIYSLMLEKLGRYSGNFIHSLGHGVGVRIHELPDFKPKSKSVMEENMVFTLEPGIYFRNRLGIRIEDTILLREKPVILTKTSRKLRTIKI